MGTGFALGVSNGTAALAADARFDAVLLDAPCSNTGVIGARANARWRFGPKSQAELVALQRRLLAEAAARVAPGGRLVYSTCSLEPEENGQTVRAFLESEPGWNVTGQQEALPAAPGTPGPIDGGFAVRLERG